MSWIEIFGIVMGPGLAWSASVYLAYRLGQRNEARRWRRALMPVHAVIS